MPRKKNPDPDPTVPKKVDGRKTWRLKQASPKADPEVNLRVAIKLLDMARELLTSEPKK